MCHLNKIYISTGSHFSELKFLKNGLTVAPCHSRRMTEGDFCHLNVFMWANWAISLLWCQECFIMCINIYDHGMIFTIREWYVRSWDDIYEYLWHFETLTSAGATGRGSPARTLSQNMSRSQKQKPWYFLARYDIYDHMYELQCWQFLDSTQWGFPSFLG